MLCLQFAIGITNDLADRGSDAVSKPYKPLSRGAVDAGSAAILAVVLMVAGLSAAATINVPTLAFFIAGLGAGLAYNFALRRTVVSWVPWWAGIAALPASAHGNTVTAWGNTQAEAVNARLAQRSSASFTLLVWRTGRPLAGDRRHLLGRRTECEKVRSSR